MSIGSLKCIRKVQTMERREFLKSAIPVAALLHGGFGGLSLFGTEKDGSTLDFDTYDLIVIGGTLFGCFAARRAARKGQRVLLIERRTFLGSDITATLRPWLHRKGWEAFDSEMKEMFLPEAEKPEVGLTFDPHDADGPFGEEIPLFCGSVKKQFMASMMQDGVHVLLMTGVWGVVADPEKTQASAVVVASKFGHHLVRCKSILDTTGQLSARPKDDRAGRRFSLEFFSVRDPVERRISVPESLGLTGNDIHLHKGKRAPRQCFVEFQFDPELDDPEHEARVKAEALCKHLGRNHQAFAESSVNRMAWQTLRVKEAESIEEERVSRNVLSIDAAKGPVLSCQDVIDMDTRLAACVDRLPVGTGREAETDVIHHRSGEIPLEQCTVTPLDDFKSPDAIQQIAFAYERHVPKRRQVDVLVAGGGTAGAMAAVAAVEQGAKVAVVEYFPELGGTKTLGGVGGWYAAHRDTSLWQIFHDGVRKERDAFGSGLTNMMSYFRKQVTEHGGQLLTNSIVCGVTMDGNRMTGIVVEREGALSILTGDVVIDATGDGDVAAFAGASFGYGIERMKTTQNYSQWDILPPGASWRDAGGSRDYDILMSHYLSEFQRGYQLTHVQSHYYDFRPMLTVRESRRIVGDYTINMRDILTQRRYPDTICLAYSNYDPHTFGDTPLTRVGCVPILGISATGAIPYRAILPKGIDGLLISGKAISETHNALQFTRMSWDVMTRGYVTGRIAASISEQGICTREFDVRSIQQGLLDLKIIQDEDRVDSEEDWDNRDTIEKRVDDLVAGKERGLLNVLMLPMEKIEPVLSKRYAAVSDDAERTHLAKALAWCGNPVGNDLLLREMKTLWEQEVESGRFPPERQPTFWPINQNIALLGMSGDRQALPAILEIADSMKLNNPPKKGRNAYEQGRTDWCLLPWYNRIINICFAVEQVPDRIAVRSLTRFLDDPYIGGNITLVPEDATWNIFPAILESRIAATLARCGEKRGFDVLVEYLNDLHYVLVDYAHRELCSMLPRDYGYEYGKWKEYINRITFPLPMVACRVANIEL